MVEGILSQHACRAVVLMCIDFRFAGMRSSAAIEKAYGLHENEYDIIALPGGAQNLTQFQLAEHYAESTLHALGVAIDLHHVGTLVILSHQNCGALKAVGRVFTDGEADAESKFHRTMLAEAADIVKAEWSDKKIETGYLCVNDSDKVVIEKVNI